VLRDSLEVEAEAAEARVGGELDRVGLGAALACCPVPERQMLSPEADVGIEAVVDVHGAAAQREVQAARLAAGRDVEAATEARRVELLQVEHAAEEGPGARQHRGGELQFADEGSESGQLQLRRRVSCL
jgi:hypothetical protein